MLDQYYNETFCNSISTISTDAIPNHSHDNTKNQVNYDVEKGMSHRQKNLIITFLRNNGNFEDADDTKWKDLVNRLNIGPGPYKTVPSWKQTIADWVSLTLLKRSRMQLNSEDFIESLTAADVKLLVTLGHLRPVEAEGTSANKSSQREDKSSGQIKKTEEGNEVLERLLDCQTKENEETIQVLGKITSILTDLDSVLNRLSDIRESANTTIDLNNSNMLT